MHKALVATVTLLVLTSSMAAPRARAGDEASVRHTLGPGPASIALPATWAVEHDEDGTWLYAQDPDEPGVLFAWTRTPLLEGETIGMFLQRQLAAERGASIRPVGWHVDDVRWEPLGDTPAVWTLVARHGARPPLRSLYVHLVLGREGHTLRVDVPLGTFDARREAVHALLATFDAGPAGDLVGALDRIRARLERDPPKTRDDYRAWIEELRLLGAAAEPALRRLLEDYVAGPGADDDAAHALLGRRRLDYEIPEEISFRGHPFLRAVERAREKRWFGPDEEGAWHLAQLAVHEAKAHEKHLREDRAFRAADGVFANIAHDPTLAGLHLTFHWSRPYALCLVSSKPSSIYDALSVAGDAARAAHMEELAETEALARKTLHAKARQLRALYHQTLEDLGEAHGLKDLMEPWGGRADLGSYRSFPDGVPLVVLVFDEEAWRRHAVATGDPRATPASTFDAHTGTLPLLREATDADTAFLGAYQLLYWFRRQALRWREPPTGGFFEIGLAAWIATRKPDAPERDSSESLARTLREAMRSSRARWGEIGKPYPMLPLRDLMGATYTHAGLARLREVGDLALASQAALPLLIQQAWAFVHYLDTVRGGALRPMLHALMEAHLKGELEHGQGVRVSARLLGLADDEDWASLQADFDAFVRDQILADPAGPPPGADDEDEANLRVVLNDAGLALVYARPATDPRHWWMLGRANLAVDGVRSTLAGVLADAVAMVGTPSLLVEGSPHGSWVAAQQVMQAAGERGVEITRMRFRVGAAGDASPEAATVRPIPVHVRREGEGSRAIEVHLGATHARIDPEEADGAGREHALARVREAAQGARIDQPLAGLLVLVDPGEGGVPPSVLADVLRTLAEADFPSLELRRAALPR